MGNTFRKTYIDVHEAAQSGHIDEVRRWIDEGKPVDARDNTQKTPLHYAAQWGQEEALDFLIECGADPNAVDFIEDTPLHLACYFGHANCARILIMVGANIAAKDCYGNTPSQIFDDHVTEPVLDEIRYIVREAMKGPTVSQHEATKPVSKISKQNASAGDRHPRRIRSANVSPRQSLPIRTGVRDGAQFAGGNEGLPSTSMPSEGAESSILRTVSGGWKQSGVSVTGTATEGSVISGGQASGAPRPLSVTRDSSGSVHVEEGEGGKGSRRNVCKTPSVSSLGRQQQSRGEWSRERAPDGMATTEGVPDCVEPEVGEKRSSLEVFSLNGTRPSEKQPLQPRLKSALPWNDVADDEQTGAKEEENPGRHPGATSGNRSDRSVPGPSPRTGSAVAGQRHTAVSPPSALSIRPFVGPNRLNASSPTSSGKRGEDNAGGKGRGSSRGVGRSKGVSLAGRLLSYATRPGGKFDVFAAARDGQVSVLKQALAEGEEVDVEDEKGLTALMWAARAGRLSTAKYLVSQGASLSRTDNSTGFSPLHFAAYYCRSSVVRALLLAGADAQATDSLSKTPGRRFYPLSYLSYEAFYHRRLIRRFLAGDLKHGVDDTGKTMFPMNSPLEAYDEEHRPQCVGLGSGEKLADDSDNTSTDESDGESVEFSERLANYRRRRSSLRLARPGAVLSHRRMSADIARKVYATMYSMNSRVDDDSGTERRSLSAGKECDGGGEGGGGDGGDGEDDVGGVRYYLRRGSLQQLAGKTRKMLGGATTSNHDTNQDDSGSGKIPRRVNDQECCPQKGGDSEGRRAEGESPRRASLARLSVMQNVFAGGISGRWQDDHVTTSGRLVNVNTGGSPHEQGHGGNDADPESGLAPVNGASIAGPKGGMATIDTVASPPTSTQEDTTRSLGDYKSCVEHPDILERVETGCGSVNGHVECTKDSTRGSVGDSKSAKRQGNDGRNQRRGANPREGDHDDGGELATPFEGQMAPRTCHYQPPDLRSGIHPTGESTGVEAGTRDTPETRGVISNGLSLSLDQEEEARLHSEPPHKLPLHRQPPRREQEQPRTESRVVVAADYHASHPIARPLSGISSENDGNDGASWLTQSPGDGSSGVAIQEPGTGEDDEGNAWPAKTTTSPMWRPMLSSLNPEKSRERITLATEEEASASAAAEAAAISSNQHGGNVIDTKGSPCAGEKEIRRSPLITDNDSSAGNTMPKFQLDSEHQGEEAATETQAEDETPLMEAEDETLLMEVEDETPLMVELQTIPTPTVVKGAESLSVKMQRSETCSEGALVPQERERVAASVSSALEENVSTPVVVSTVEEGGEERDWRIGGTRPCQSGVTSGEESLSEIEGRRSGGRTSHKHKHKHKHKHRHRHRHKEKRRLRQKDYASGDQKAESKDCQQVGEDHDPLRACASTKTTLAPLKRLPPPSGFPAQRSTEQVAESVAETASDDLEGRNSGLGGG